MAKKKTFENVISNLLGEPVSNLCHAFYDQYVEANVKFRSKAGMKTVIIRRQLGKCCEWCANLAGIYTPEKAPADIYRRHDNCKCMVTYKDEDGYTDVWSKKDYESQKEARLVRERKLLKERTLRIATPSSTQSLQKSLEAIKEGKAGLSKARESILKRVPNSGDSHKFRKNKISIHDLAYLSAETGHEFSLFRGKVFDILVHGDIKSCNIDSKLSDELLSKGYEWIAHSHVDLGKLVPSPEDRKTLAKFNQERSVIIGPTGKEITFTVSEFD